MGKCKERCQVSVGRGDGECGKTCGGRCRGVRGLLPHFSTPPFIPTLSHTHPICTLPHRHTFSHTFLHPNTHPTPLPTSPTPLPHTHLTPPSAHLPKYFLTRTLHTSSELPHLFQHFPILTSSFNPYQNFSLFSSIAKLVKQSSRLETPCKFRKKKFENKNKKWQHNI